MSEHKLSPSKRLMFSFMLAGASLILLELLASSAILYRLRASNTENVSRSEVSDISLINILHEAGVRVGLFAELEPFEYRRETQPAPFLRPDAELGYAGRPGTYLNTFSRRRNRTTRSQWEHARFKVTINEDGRRWTGHSADDNKPSVYVLGDSWVFGTGVNDEQTFSSLLQQARPDLNVRLFAWRASAVVEEATPGRAAPWQARASRPAGSRRP